MARTYEDVPAGLGRSVYVAGPMRGVPLFNFPAFDEAAAALRNAGWVAFNPAEHDRDMGFDEHQYPSLEGFDMRKAFTWDAEAIFASDAIFLLRGWERSTGANLELNIARFVGSEILWQQGAVNPMPEFESIAQEAHRLVNGARQGDYGHPADDFARTGRMWGAILGIPDVEPHLIGLMLAALKISRHVNRPKRDNLTDLAGYAATVELVHQRLDGWPSPTA